MTRFLPAILIASLLLLITPPVFAVPNIIDFQGRLLDNNRNPQGGQFNMTFSIFNESTSGSLLWQENKLVNVSNGLFTVLLGDTIGLNLTFNEDYYVEVIANGETFAPRYRVSTVPYAYRSQYASADNTSEPSFIFERFRNQTSNLTEWQNETGFTMASVDKYGRFVGDGSLLTGIIAAINDSTTDLPATNITPGTFGIHYQNGSYAFPVNLNVTHNLTLGNTTNTLNIYRDDVGNFVFFPNNKSVIFPGRYASGLPALSAVAIGANASVATTHSIAIGTGATVSNVLPSCIVIGSGAVCTENYQLLLGGPDTYIREAYIGGGPTRLNPNTVTLQTSGGIGGSNYGGTIVLAGGKATGTGVPGSVVFKVSNGTAPSSTLQDLVEVGRFNGSTRYFGIGTAATIARLHVAGTENLNNLSLNVNDTLYVNGSRVGIMTPNPTHELHVVGDVNVTGTTYLSTLSVTNLDIPNNLSVGRNFSVGPNTLFVDHSTARVGIGTATPAEELHVIGDINVTGNYAPINVDVVRSAVSAGTYLDFGSNVIDVYASGGLQINTGNIEFYSGTRVPLSITPGSADGVPSTISSGYDQTGWYHPLHYRSGVLDGATAIAHIINTTGNLTTEGAKLVSVQNNGTEKFFIDKDGDTWFNGYLNVTGDVNTTGNVCLSDGTCLSDLGAAAGGWTDDGDVVRLTTVADMVGIGTTNPLAKLNIQGVNDTTGLSLNVNNTLYVNGTNVGIGTGNPQRPIHATENVDGTTGAWFLNPSTGTSALSAVLVGDSTAGGNYGYLGHFGENYADAGLIVANRTILVGSDTAGLVIVSNAASMIFATGGTAASNERMRITANGDIGIGTTNPSDKLHVNGFIQTEVVDWTLKKEFTGANDTVRDLEVYNGKLYAGMGTDLEEGDLFVFNGTDWALEYDFGGDYARVEAMEVYENKLYVGLGNDSLTQGGLADIYFYNGTHWVLSTDLGAEYESVWSLQVYNGKLYAGTGTTDGDGDIWEFDGSTWSLSYNLTGYQYAYPMATYNGKLYVGMGYGADDGDVYSFDGSTWSLAYDFGAQYETIYSLGVHDGKLYAGTGYSGGDAAIYVYDGSSWKLSQSLSPYNGVYSLRSYNGRMYAGLGQDAGEGDVYVLIDGNWTQAADLGAAYEQAWDMEVYNGKLYVGTGSGADDADIFAYSERLESQLTEDLGERFEKFVTTSQHFTDNVSILGILNVTGNTYLSNLTIEGIAMANGDMTVSGNLSVLKNFSVGPNNLFVDNSTGRVGIGTATPSSALEVSGNITITQDAFFIGNRAQATGQDSIAIGNIVNATGLQSIAIGKGANSSNDRTIAIGVNSKAAGQRALAIGWNSEVSGDYGTALGTDSFVNTDGTAIGLGSQATSGSGVAVGRSTYAGNSATALGRAANASGSYSVAIGYTANTTTDASESIAIGLKSMADASYAVVVGSRANATSNNAIAIGYKSNSSNTDTIAIGENARSTGVQSIAIGSDAQATDTGAISIGDDTETSGDGSIAIGDNAWTNTNIADAIAIGRNSNVSTRFAIAIGGGSYAGPQASIALGYGASASVINSVAVGEGALATGSASSGTAIGTDSIVTGASSFAAGASAQAGTRGIAIGNLANASSSTNMIAIGYMSKTNQPDAIAFGHLANAFNDRAIAIGMTANATNSDVIAIGSYTNASGQDSISIGQDAQASNTDAMAMGRQAHANDTDSIALGRGAVVYEAQAIAIGTSAFVDDWGTGEGGLAIGYNARDYGGGGVAIGHDAFIGETDSQSIAIGKSSNATGLYSLAIGASSLSTNQLSVAVGYNSLTHGNSATAYGDSASAAAEGFAAGASADAFGGQSVAVGRSSNSSGQFSTAVGYQARAWNSRGITIGQGANSYGDSGIAIGNVANSTNGYSIAIGRDSEALAESAIAIGGGSGNGARATDLDAIAMGRNSEASQDNAIAIGENANASDQDTIAIGQYARASQANAIAIGENANATTNAVAIGFDAIATDLGAISIGDDAYTTGDGSIAIGDGAWTETGIADAIAIGDGSNVSTRFGISIGSGSLAVAQASIALGYTAEAENTNTIVIGNGAAARGTSTSGIAVGIDSLVTGASGIAMGDRSNAGRYAVAIGLLANSTGANSAIAVGYSSKADDPDAVAIGHNSNALQDRAIAIGMTANATAGDSIAIGSYTNATNSGSVALGRDAQTTADNQLVIGSPSYNLNTLIHGSLNVTGDVNVTSDYDFCIDGGNCLSNFADAGNVTSNGSAGYIPVFTNATNIGNSIMTEVQGAISIDGNLSMPGAFYIGNGAAAIGSDALAVGNSATSENTSTIAIGELANASGLYSTAIGYNARATQSAALAIGSPYPSGQTRATGTYAIAIGNAPEAPDTSSIAIGTSANATGTYTVAIGHSAQTMGGSLDRAVAIGYDTYAEGSGALALGYEARSNVGYGIAMGMRSVANGAGTAIGWNADAGGASSVALGGYVPNASANDAIAIGSYVNASAVDTIAMGHFARATQTNAIAIGEEANAAGTQDIAIGYQAESLANYGVSIGYNASVANSGVAYGTSATAAGASDTGLGRATMAAGGNSVAVGFQAQSIGGNSVSIGYNADANGTDSIMLGRSASATGDYAVGMGAIATATSDYGIALGYDANSSGLDAIAIGQGTVAFLGNAIAIGKDANANNSNALAIMVDADATAADTIAIGQNSKSLDSYSISIGNNAKSLNQNSITMGRNAFSSGGSSLSIGNAANASGGYGIAIGTLANASHDDSVCIGFNCQTTANNQFMVGAGTDPLSLNVTGDINVTAGYDVCIDGGSCLSTGGGSGNTSGTGAAGYIPQWQDHDTLNNSIMFQEGTYIGINTTTPGSPLHVVQEGLDDILTIGAYVNTYTWNNLVFERSGTSYASPSQVSNGANLARILFKGYDGSSYDNAAAIYVQVDGATSTNDMPGKFVFYTSRDGTNSIQPRMVLDNMGRLGLGNVSEYATNFDSNFTAMLQINGTNPQNNLSLDINEILYVNSSSGWVGIGVSDPGRGDGDDPQLTTAGLHIKNPVSGNESAIVLETINSSWKIRNLDRWGRFSISQFFPDGTSVAPFKIFNGTSHNQFVIQENGTGIGTNNPKAWLHVDGTDLYNNISLNVNDTLYVNASASRVGIGTASPATMLDVRSSSSSVNPGITSTNDAGVASYFYTARSGHAWSGKTVIQNSGSSDVFFSGSGNVGVGAQTTNAKLHVNGTYSTSGLSLNVNDTLYVNNSRVGIGTSSPGNLFHVSAGPSGSITSLEVSDDDGTDPYNLNLYTDTTYQRIIMRGLTGTQHQALVFSDGYGYNTMFGISSSTDSGSTWLPKFVLQQRGLVGIGATNPEALFHVNGTDPFNGNLSLNINNTLYVNASGRVGIGTSDPDEEFVISTSSVSPAIEIATTSTTNNQEKGKIIFSSNDNDLAEIRAYRVNSTNGELRFKTRQAGTLTTHMVINSSGNVGIGTLNPSMELHVNGSVNITENIFYGGNLTGYGTDVAEYVNGIGVEPGDVVIISEYSDVTVEKTDVAYDTRAAGIVSTAPGHTLGLGEGNVKLALAGRVPVKVTTENGSINRGDLLTTSSTPGHAMRCESRSACTGSIIGKAMENFYGDNGVITALVVLG